MSKVTTCLHGLRLPASCALVAAILASFPLLSGCAPQAVGHLDLLALRYQDQFRLDRQPLSQVQRNAPVGGPYHNDRDQPALPLSPALPADLIGHLMQSDCLWSAYDPVEQLGDSMRLNWEGVLTMLFFFPEQEVIGPVELAMCRLNDPVSGGEVLVRAQGLQAGSGFAALHEDGTISVSERAESLGGAHLIFFSKPGEVRFSGEARDFLHSSGAFLTAMAPALGAEDPFGVCTLGPTSVDMQGLTATPLDRPVVLAPGVQGLDCLGTELGSLVLCADNCRWRPQHDSALVLSGATNIQQVTDKAIAPHLKVVSGSRSIRRRMQAQGDLHSWSTPELGPAGPGRRWRENFLPTVLATEARLVALDAAGQPLPVPTTASVLCLRDDPGQASCRLRCEAEPGAPGAFNLLDRCFNPRVQSYELRSMTPTYDVEALEAGLVERPLHWSVDLSSAPLPTGAALYIEFTLLNIGQTRAGLMAEPAGMNFGPLRIAQLRHAQAEFSNVGGVPIMIEQVSLDPNGNGAGEYQLELLGPARALPLPIDIVADGSKLRLAPDLENELLGDISISQIGSPDAGQDLLLRRDPQPTQPRIYAYAQDFERLGPQLLHGVGAESFEAAALRDHQTRFPASLVEAGQIAGRPLLRGSRARWTPPFLLQPGERFVVDVRAMPAAYGRRDASVVARARTLALPSEWLQATVQVSAFGTHGGDLSVLPVARLFVPDAQDASSLRRRVLLLNNGDAVAERGQIRIDGDFADRYALHPATPASAVISAGDQEVLEIEYRPRRCHEPELAWRIGLPHEAELQVPVLDGVVLSVALRQSDDRYCAP